MFSFRVQKVDTAIAWAFEKVFNGYKNAKRRGEDG
jgi:hypothetical protein